MHLVEASWVVAMFTLLTGLLASGGHFAHAFSQGAPSVACTGMKPNHGAAAQTTQSPYTVKVSSTQVRPSETVTVTISGNHFKGFMVTAFSNDFPVGTMTALNDQSQVICHDLSITHTSPAYKTEVTFEWRAPDDLTEGKIDIQATVVQSLMVFWTKIFPLDSLELVAAQPVVSSVQPEEPATVTLPASSGSDVSLTAVRANSPADKPATKELSTGGSDEQSQLSSLLAPDSFCGKTKGCFHDCVGTHCTFMVTWQSADQEHLLLSITYRLPYTTEHWIAIGFSRDQEMGDDSVTECIMYDGKVKVQQSFNDDTNNKYLDDRKAALSEETGKLEDGVLHCTFRRKKSYPRDSKVFDLNEKYFLMVAVGEALKGNKLPHAFDTLPPVSKSEVDFQVTEHVASKEPSVSIAVQAHGALMIISWMMLTSFGVMSAKYGKPLLPKCNPCGVNIWFQMHRSSMVLTTLLSVVAVLLVMIMQCEGYCQIPKVAGKIYWPLHPPLGFFVLLLTIVNPIMALFRPEPKAPNRYVFTWSHWGVGALAWIMATFSIFTGLDLEQAPVEATYVMLGWGIYHIVFLVVMEIVPRPLCRLLNFVAAKTLQRGRVYNLESALHDNLGYVDPQDDGQTPVPATLTPADSQKKVRHAPKELNSEELKVQRALLLTHYAVVLLFTVTLLLIFFLYKPSSAAHDHHTPEDSSNHA